MHIGQCLPMPSEILPIPPCPTKIVRTYVVRSPPAKKKKKKKSGDSHSQAFFPATSFASANPQSV